MLSRFFETIIGSGSNSDDTLPGDAREVITILGRGDGYDYFGTLLNHARVIIDSYLRNSKKNTNKERVLSKAIAEPLAFNKAFISRNFIEVHFYSEADMDVVNSYDYKRYVSSSSYDGVDIWVTYHVSEFVIRNNQLSFVKNINSRSELGPAMGASNGDIYLYDGQIEVSENRFFVLNGNVHNSTIKRVSLYGGDDMQVDWEVNEEHSGDVPKNQSAGYNSANEVFTYAEELVSLDYIDNKINGFEFEKFTGLLLKRNGFTDVTVTKASGDYGCDVIATKDFVKYAFQCKKYSSPVGIEAVQAALGSKEIYKCHVAVVLTNNTFTANARTLAEKTNVLLWGRDMLMKLINNSGIKMSDIQ